MEIHFTHVSVVVEIYFKYLFVNKYTGLGKTMTLAGTDVVEFRVTIRYFPRYILQRPDLVQRASAVRLS